MGISQGESMGRGDLSGLNPTSPAAESPTLDQFNAQLERYDRLINMYEAVLQPVLFTYEEPGKVESVPREAPQSRLHNSVLELERLNDRLEQLRSRIRL